MVSSQEPGLRCRREPFTLEASKWCVDPRWRDSDRQASCPPARTRPSSLLMRSSRAMSIPYQVLNAKMGNRRCKEVLIMQVVLHCQCGQKIEVFAPGYDAHGHVAQEPSRDRLEQFSARLQRILAIGTTTHDELQAATVDAQAYQRESLAPSQSPAPMA